MISIISTYKNRRHHIEKTFSTWLDQDLQNKYEIIIVDYTSEDNLHEFFPSHPYSEYCSILHVKCFDYPSFSISHARNIGSRHSSNNWLFFLDIDTYLKPHALSTITGLINEYYDTAYYAAVNAEVRKNIINGGLMVIPRKFHAKVFGFNENMQGWGFEDIDYKQRLENVGLKYCHIPSDIYSCIDHEDSQRTQCYTDSKELSWTKNRQTSLQKWDNPDFGQCSKMTLYEYPRLK